MTTFTIMIDEDQRSALLDHLIKFGEPTELEFWIDMLKDLPKIEKDEPNTIHGFCL